MKEIFAKYSYHEYPQKALQQYDEEDLDYTKDYLFNQLVFTSKEKLNYPVKL